jgi:hypothetical protein
VRFGILLCIKIKTMATEIKTEITIHASPDKVWGVLSDFKNYPLWNPWVIALKGEVKEGSKIEIQLPNMTFKPRVLTFKKNKELRWLGHFLFPGLFDGEHTLELIANQNGTTTFKHSEIFKGILVPLFKKQLLQTTKSGFEAMNKKLKERVEGR